MNNPFQEFTAEQVARPVNKTVTELRNIDLSWIGINGTLLK